ncbi:hypothetical protein F1654_03475 [Alkalicaulis satelles]|uniref:Haem-binding uptake Tiki superfamily ChaN domain-containing protein n=1 Tax=Alkalicaulis satelles TaxID=2609175 RepID=A0A5M6ZJR5_9PROT|nr:hypothetical protein [Alkalicaulis satelles]KAA5805066.1 hypothetical protein F1654_03475 [Alkalicaulis satelles]
MISAVLALSASLALAPTPLEQSCGAWAGAEAILDSPRSNIILLGESHGNAEQPHAVGALLCVAAGRGERILLALEIPGTEDDRLQRFMASDGSLEARAELFDGSWFWTVVRDGRSSLALFRLLEYARTLREARHSIDVAAADRDAAEPVDAILARFPGPLPDVAPDALRHGARNLHMAVTVAKAWDTGGYDRILMMSGAMHVRRSVTENQFYFPRERMVRTLPYVATPLLLGDRPVRTFRLVHSGGVTEGYTGDEPVFGQWTAPPNAPAGLSPGSSIFNPDALYDADFDGIIHVGQVSVSPRAVDVLLRPQRADTED